MEGTIKIIFFYAEVIGYTMGMLKALKAIRTPVIIDVVYWDKQHVNSNLFKLVEREDIKFHPRSSFNVVELANLLRSRKPDILFISGWMDRGYISAVKKYKRDTPNIQVVCGIDDQWKNTFRQRVGRIFFALFYKKLFDFMWVCGKPQYHYAERMGYTHERIITNLYSADTSIFRKPGNASKRFVFVGRFHPLKGITKLIEAYDSLPEEVKTRWPLIIIGDGALKDEIYARRSKYVTVKPFMQPGELMQELMQGGVACITSDREQWGVVIHELAILGFPLVLSSACGAATEFLITGYNGFLFRWGSKSSLRDALLKITMLSDEELKLFSERSHNLGERITSEHTAYSLFSVIPLSKI